MQAISHAVSYENGGDSKRLAAWKFVGWKNIFSPVVQ